MAKPIPYDKLAVGKRYRIAGNSPFAYTSGTYTITSLQERKDGGWHFKIDSEECMDGDHAEDYTFYPAEEFVVCSNFCKSCSAFCLHRNIHKHQKGTIDCCTQTPVTAQQENGLKPQGEPEIYCGDSWYVRWTGGYYLCNDGVVRKYDILSPRSANLCSETKKIAEQALAKWKARQGQTVTICNEKEKNMEQVTLYTTAIVARAVPKEGEKLGKILIAKEFKVQAADSLEDAIKNRIDSDKDLRTSDVVGKQTTFTAI